MRLVVLSAFVLPVVVSAHNHALAHHHARQAGPEPTTTASASGSSDTLTFSLLATNPTALPIANITSGMPTQATVALATTYTPGALPTGISGAPPMPDPASLVISDYPTMDKVPPTDTPLVQQWIQEVMNSGVYIPDIPPTAPGGCSNASNAAAVANATANGWWTCGGTTRATDIVDCPVPHQWGLTYDDGPAPYTPSLLQYLEQQDLHATFFTIGSRIIERPGIFQADFMGGHQVGLHTWSHPEMTTLTTEQVIAEFGYTKMIMKQLSGLTPLYWRPPYGDIDDRIRAISTAMNMAPVIWSRLPSGATFDTGDWNVAGGEETAIDVMNQWDSIMGNASTFSTGFIVLEHDLFQETVDIAIDYVLPDAQARTPKLNITPVITCLNFPLSNAYSETNDNTTNPPPLQAYLANHTTSANSSSSTGASGQASNSNGASNGALGVVAYAPALAVSVFGMLVGITTLLL